MIQRARNAWQATTSTRPPTCVGCAMLLSSGACTAHSPPACSASRGSISMGPPVLPVPRRGARSAMPMTPTSAWAATLGITWLLIPVCCARRPSTNAKNVRLPQPVLSVLLDSISPQLTCAGYAQTCTLGARCVRLRGAWTACQTSSSTLRTYCATIALTTSRGVRSA